MGKRTPTWRLYEQQIFDELRKKAPDAVVSADARLPGLYSGVPRQIDVLVTGTFPGLDEPQHMVVKCKAFSRAVNVKDVEMAFGLVTDVGAPFGLLVTTEGYSAAAEKRAVHCRGLTLEVVQLDELSKWIPRRPSIAWTSGTNTATITWHDDAGFVRTDVVTRDLAERLVKHRSSGAR